MIYRNTKTGYEELRWVAKARGERNARFRMDLIMVSNGWAMASDGHRVHAAETTLIDGDYEVVKNTARELHLVPVAGATMAPIERCLAPRVAEGLFLHYEPNVAAATIIRAIHKSGTLNTGYMADVLGAGSRWHVWIDRQREVNEMGPVYFETADHKLKAAIMPMSMEG